MVGIRSGRLKIPDWLSKSSTYEEIELMAGELTLDEEIVQAHIRWYKSGQCKNADLGLIILAGSSLKYWLGHHGVELNKENEKED